MATPAQTLNCPEQKIADSVDQQGQVSVGSLKNGSMMDDMSSDELPGAMNNSIQSPNSNINTKARSVKMENFQDGGTHQLNIRPTAASGPEQIGYPSGIERQRISQDFPGYSQNNRDSLNEDYHNSQENYNHIIGNSNYASTTERSYLQEHGGHSLSGNNTELNANSQQNKLYPQYNQSQMRPMFSQTPRPIAMGSQPRHSPTSSVPIMASYPNNSQQRLLSGQSISQQGGPTPTLNQLLQSPNTPQRYHNSYNEYAGPPTQYPGSSSTNSGPHGWGNIRTSNAYSQPISSMFRNQIEFGNSLNVGKNGEQRIALSGHAKIEEYIEMTLNRTKKSQGNKKGRPKKQTGATTADIKRTYQQQQPQPGSGPPPSGQDSPSNPQYVTAAQGPGRSPYPPRPAPSQQPPPPQQQQPTDPEPQAESPPDATPPPLRAPASSPLRPSPSPSPASAPTTPGPPSSISMPPRPPSSQSESSGQNQINSSPMAAQGYSQQMAPPPGMYGNKMHPSMMAGTSPYSPQRSGIHPQANSPNYMGMQNYGSLAPGQNSYPGGYPSRQQQNFGGYMNYSAYGGGGGMMPPPPSQYGGKSPMPPPPNQQQQGPPQTQGPTNSVTAANLRQSPMYLRQHLQQKMYGGVPPVSSAPAPSPSAASEGPMPPPVSASSSPYPSSSCDSTEYATTQTPPATTSPSLGPPPPPILDEGSQASNASASSSLPEEHETKSGKQGAVSHPPTPNTLPSPGAASMSSFHDEFESVSSPSWPRTPASPVINSQPYDHLPIKRPDGLLKLYDMSDDPDRRMFLDKLITYNEERGNPISQCPTISKQPLDLYRLYLIVKDRGGFIEVTKAKHWKDVAGALGIGASSSAAYTLRKQYIKHLLPFECKYDRGGIDPMPIISQVEASMKKKGSSKNQNCHDAYGPGAMMDGYPGGYPGAPYGMPNAAGYPPSQYGQGDAMHPGMPNHMGGTAEDPFAAEEMQQQQHYPPREQYPGYGQQHPYHPASYPVGHVPPESYGSSGTEPYPPSSDPPPNSSSPAFSRSDSYPSTAGDYATNRTANNLPASTPPTSYPPYSSSSTPVSIKQERYEASPSLPPSAGGAPSQPEYPQRYPTPTGEGAAPPPSTFPRPPGQYPPASSTPSQPPYSTSDPAYRPTAPPSSSSADQPSPYQNHVSRLQSSLAQRLLAKVTQPSTSPGFTPSPQSIAGSAGGAYPGASGPPSKPREMYPRDMYPPSAGKYPGGKEPPYPPYPPPAAYPPGSERQYPYRHMLPPSSAPPNQGWHPRGDYRQYPTQGQYVWDGGPPRHPSAEPTAPPPTWQQQQSYGPSTEPFAKSGPPYGPRPPYGPSPNKMQPHPSLGPTPQPSQPHPYMGGPAPPGAPRKEILFPPHTVEAVTPVLNKRRRMGARDVSPLEAWRLLMALKSGLLAESTWALDVLNILLFDDSTVLYFGLGHMPGLLEVLMEHYRRCLYHMFHKLTEDLEIGYNFESSEPEELVHKDRKWYQVEDDKKEDKPPTSPLVIDPGDKVTLLSDSDNFTRVSRCGKPIKIRTDHSLFLFDPDKKWDTFEGFNSGTDHWQMGGGDTTIHIQTHFEPMDSCLKFVRVMEDKESESSKEEQEEREKLLMSPLKESCNKSVSIPVLNCIKNPLVLDDKDNPSSKSSDVNENCDEKKDAESSCEEKITYPRIRPSSIKRKQVEDVEEEAYNRDEPSLYLVSDAQNSLASRCICVSTILRNLSFVPGNDSEMAKHPGFLMVLGRLLLLHHKHSPRRPSQRHYDKEEGDGDGVSGGDSCSSLTGEDEWWWEALHALRENTLVTLANVACQLDLAPFPEEISLPLLDGLLHWATCPSSYAQDPLPHSSLSPQRLSLETLCKLSILDNNMDLLLATPSWTRTQRLLGFLARSLGRHEDQPLREFAVVLLSNLARADSSAARAIALQPPAIPHLLLFVEQAEQSAYQVANSQGVGALRENPELMGTTLDMVRRAAGTLRCLAKVPDNRPLFLPFQPRLLTLVMSQILDQGVAAIVADVLYECSLDT